MSRMKKGNGLLRFLVFAALFALVLTGCNGARKYEAVDLSSETAAGAEMSGNGADLAAESTDTGASGPGDADAQALGEAAGEPLSADPEGGDVASESSELAEAASESEELSSEMSEAESVEAAREAPRRRTQRLRAMMLRLHRRFRLTVTPLPSTRDIRQRRTPQKSLSARPPRP